MPARRRLVLCVCHLAVCVSVCVSVCVCVCVCGATLYVCALCSCDQCVCDSNLTVGPQPRYQLFGASMDVVQAMEQSSEPGRVHMSAEFVAAIEDGGEDFLVCDRQPDGSAFLDVPVGDELVDV